MRQNSRENGSYCNSLGKLEGAKEKLMIEEKNSEASGQEEDVWIKFLLYANWVRK